MFERLPLTERVWVLRQLKDETVGGALLILAATVALVWANSPWGDVYQEINDFKIGPEALNLHLSLNTWAADGLLAIFFFVAGLELKHELVKGSLSRVSQAAVPVAAALGGMIVPAGIYAVVNLTAQGGQPKGWGIPMATDIAFALAVLAVAGRQLPVALRAFLLTLAVVDDLGAITVIAVFYSEKFHALAFVGSLLCMLGYWLAQRARVRSPWLYIPLALATWVLMHEAGVHATVAGVALAMLTRIKEDPGEAEAPAERMQHLLHPLSAGFCVPVFAFFAAGIDLRGQSIASAVENPVAIGVILGLVVGKPIGVLLGASVTARFTRASLAKGLSWLDVAAVGLLAGIGFTVSLLIAELAFEYGSEDQEYAKVAVLAASLLAASLAIVALRIRARSYRLMYEEEEVDGDQDGIPDVYNSERGLP
ncbi:MAG: Na+/H+ antiporter NhaA [Candidatus Nanopelagicales bacterium]